MSSLAYLNLGGFNSALEKLDLSFAPNLESCCLDISSLTSLDVHGCAKFGDLFLGGGGNFQELNVADCVSLSDLPCPNNQLKVLDVKGCSSLKTLNCSYNQLESLDVTGNPALQSHQIIKLCLQT